MKFDEVPFVPCNDCTAYESCTQEAYEQGKKDAQEECERCIYSGKRDVRVDAISEFVDWLGKRLAEVRIERGERAELYADILEKLKEQEE